MSFVIFKKVHAVSLRGLTLLIFRTVYLNLACLLKTVYSAVVTKCTMGLWH